MTAEGKSPLKQVCSDVWWLVLLRGLALVALGILLFTRTGGTLMVIMTFLGAYWFVDGIFTLVASIRGRKSTRGWAWGVFVGTLGILAGLVVFSRPLAIAMLTQVFLVYFLGIMALVSGISGIVTGIRVRKEVSGEWSMILGGLLWTLFGLLLLGSPLYSALVLIYILAALAVVGGIWVIMVAFGIRKLAQS
jgi:uncharacterized membrane protein HdeD (DUF308 family)